MSDQSRAELRERVVAILAQLLRHAFRVESLYARTDVVRWLGSSLEELGLISIVDQQFYLTPEGFSLLSHVAIDEGKAMIRSQR